MIVRIAAAAGKVRPLARPEVLDITPSGFRVCRGQMDICEQGVAPRKMPMASTFLRFRRSQNRALAMTMTGSLARGGLRIRAERLPV